MCICRFYSSCSNYAIRTIEKYKFLKGDVIMIKKRFIVIISLFIVSFIGCS
ncbi:membrane protein insertion efficiency factor YidD, partial [Candidatus Poribacteria bacterium]|nr:membrane protein insertion efficiency factor YidD [Candidatus Poribacteria bacterium]